MKHRVGIAIVIIALAMSASLLAWTFAATTTVGTPTSSSSQPTGGVPFSGGSATRLTLHSIQYLEGIIHRSLTVPSTATLGPSYRILGGYLYGAVNLTTTNNNQWEALLYISSGQLTSFTNGTTTNLDVIKSGGIEIVETGIPPSTPLNSSAAAQSILAPVVSCTTVGSAGAASSTCTTLSSTGSSYITKINGLSIVVNPKTPALTWVDDRNHMGMQINGQNVQQLLTLANSMTQPTR